MGYRTLIPPTVENKAVYRAIRNFDKAEANDKSFESRCYDYSNNTVCRFVHDKDGNRVKDLNGKAIPTKCGECPRTGLIGGNPLNCCCFHVCSVSPECWRCPHPNQGGVPQSLGSFNVPRSIDHVKNAEDKQFLETLKSLLDKEEMAYYKAVFQMEQTPIEYVRDLQAKNPEVKFDTIKRQQTRIRKRIIDKATALREKYF